MTEEKEFCRICKNLGIDCETGTFYCSLSHRPDKLPNNLKCEEFSLCNYIERLEQENKELKQQYNCYACDTCQGKEDYRNMKRHCENAIKTVHNYRSALEEIREIAKDLKQTKIPFCTIEEKIQNKINEVLE